MNLDYLLLGLYALATIYTRSRIAAAALLLFGVSMVAGSYADNFEPWAYYAANSVIFAALTYSRHKEVAKSAWLIMVFQYIMAWDAFLFPSVETILYSSYTAVAFVLNIALIIFINRTRRGYAGNINADYNAPVDRIFGI